MPQVVIYLAEVLATYLGTGTIVSYALATIIVVASLYGISSLIPTPGIDVQRQKQMIRQAVAPRRRAYGTVKAAGVLAFLKAKNAYLYNIIMIVSHEVDSVLEYWLNDIDVTSLRAGTGYLTTARWVADSDSDGGPYPMVKIQTRLGLDTETAYSEMVAAFPGAWTSAHRLDGIFSALLIERTANKDFHFFYPSGPYTLNLVFRAAKVWDPRISGQDPDDDSTWEWSDNLALIVLDYLRHDDGMRLPFSFFTNVVDDWANQADICDEDVNLAAGGTEKRYRLSGMYEFTMQPKDVLPKMLEPAGASIEMLGDGSVVPRVMRCGVDDPDVVISDADILSYTMRRGLDKSDTRNEIRANYTSPTADYVEQEADPWLNQASIDLHGVQSVTLDLTWCPSHAQARRRMKMEAYRLDPDWSGEILTNAYGLNALASRFIRVQITELGIDEVFEKLSFQAEVGTGVCKMQIRSFPQAALDWTPDEEEGEEPNVSQTSEGDNYPSPPEGFDVTFENIGGIIQLQASANPSGRIDLLFEVEWQQDTYTWVPFTSTSPGGGYYATYQPAFADTTYQVRARFVSTGGLPSDYVTDSVTPTGSDTDTPAGTIEEVSL